MYYNINAGACDIKTSIFLKKKEGNHREPLRGPVLGCHKCYC